jgi:hypothetical protein
MASHSPGHSPPLYPKTFRNPQKVVATDCVSASFYFRAFWLFFWLLVLGPLWVVFFGSVLTQAVPGFIFERVTLSILPVNLVTSATSGRPFVL